MVTEEGLSAGASAAGALSDTVTASSSVSSFSAVAIAPTNWSRTSTGTPLRESPHINVCIEHTDYRPLPLESLVTLAKHLLAGEVPEGATTADTMRNAERANGHAARCRGM